MRQDWNFALLVKTIIDLFTDPKKGQAIKLEECKLNFDTGEDKEKEDGHLKTMMNRLLGFFHLHGIKNKLLGDKNDENEEQE